MKTKKIDTRAVDFAGERFDDSNQKADAVHRKIKILNVKNGKKYKRFDFKV